MSLGIKRKCSLAALLLITIGLAQAGPKNVAPAKKTYTLVNLQKVVSNSDQCDALYSELEQFVKTPVDLQFANKAATKDLDVKELTGKVVNHNYSIAKQSVLGHTVHRTGLGFFEVDNQKINYIVEISADTEQADFKYLYPIILSGDNGHCYYTALLKPSDATIAAFKKNLDKGLVSKKTDLMSQ
jgi:hypothetical protein